MTAPPKWDHHAILAELRRRGMTLTKLAEINGLNPNRFRSVWSRTHRKAEQAIAEFLGRPVEELFPSRYPIRTRTVLDSRWEESGASQKSAAVRTAEATRDA